MDDQDLSLTNVTPMPTRPMRRAEHLIYCDEDECRSMAATIVVTFYAPGGPDSDDPMWSVGRPPKHMPRPVYCRQHTKEQS